MRDVGIVLFVAGVFLLVHSVYTERIRELQRNPRVEYRFVPRDPLTDVFFEGSTPAVLG